MGVWTPGQSPGRGEVSLLFLHEQRNPRDVWVELLSGELEMGTGT
jgi:hypothetical protein